MRHAYDNALDNAFTKLMAHQRDSIQNEIFRFSDINDRTLSRFRSGPCDFGAQQLMNVVDISDFAVVGSTTSSTIVGA